MFGVSTEHPYYLMGSFSVCIRAKENNRTIVCWLVFFCDVMAAAAEKIHYDCDVSIFLNYFLFLSATEYQTMYI